MKFTQVDVIGVVIIEPQTFYDDRGWFMESFNEKEFKNALCNMGLPCPDKFVQDNHSYSKKGVLRGLHFQREPYAQGKMVRVISGAVYDVVVDIRPKSPTYGKSFGIELSIKNNRMLWVPEGFAHGFLALEDDTHFLYKTSEFYHKEYEESLNWNDPALEIDWPSMPNIIINEKDKEAPFLHTLTCTLTK